MLIIPCAVAISAGTGGRATEKPSLSNNWAVDVLRAEGKGQPKTVSVRLHCRIIGRPGRFASSTKILDYLTKFSDIWVARRIDIAWRWQALHAPGQ